MLESRPDFRFGLSYIDVGRRQDTAGLLNPPEENGKDSVSLLVGINLPIYRKRIRAGIAEARESATSNQQALASVQDQLLYLVQEAVLRLESTGQQGRLYRDVLIPQAHESLGSAEAAYVTNQLNFLDLLDAERILFQVRLTFKRLLADYWIALADIEQATGRAFPASDLPAVKSGEEEDLS
jgi:outer membrane protein TolC